jgi:hypothetical protein
MPDRDSPWRTLLQAELPEMPQMDMDVRGVGEACCGLGNDIERYGTYRLLPTNL